MSDFPREKKRKPPVAAPVSEDPWAKWRKPAQPVGGEPVVDEPLAVDKSRPAKTAAKAAPQNEPFVESVEPFRPTGTLGLKKTGGETVARDPRKKPLRGGPRPFNQKREAPAEMPRKTPSTVQVVQGKPVSPVLEAPHPDGERLSKIMSQRGFCSRREADLWIERGWVFVDGEQITELGTRINALAEVTISKEAERDQAKQVTILLHKPVGYVSGQPEPGDVPAVTLIKPDNQVVQSGDPEFKPWMLRGLAPAGRLDIDSTGLLVLTSDGRVAKRLIGENSEVEKEYLVRVSGELIKGGLDLLRHGLELDGKPLKPAWVKQLNEDQLHFILKEGKKRQIRRMCEQVGLRVVGLKRVRMGRIRLGDLPMGEWRFLRADEAF